MGSRRSNSAVSLALLALATLLLTSAGWQQIAVAQAQEGSKDVETVFVQFLRRLAILSSGQRARFNSAR